VARVVVLDFESCSSVDLKVAGAWRYSEDPTTSVICAGYQIDNTFKALWTPAGYHTSIGAPRLNELAADPETIFVAHNAGFEKAIWRNIMVPVHGFPDILNSRWHDTMAVCAMRNIPLDLEHAATVLKLPHQKDTEGSRITLSLSRPNKKGYYERTPEKLERVYSYCLQDIGTEVALQDSLGYLPSAERDVWLLDQRINERGVWIDLEFVSAARRIVASASRPLLDEFVRLTGVKPTQRDKVLAWVNTNGYPLEDLKKETLAKLLGEETEDDDGDTTDEPLPRLPENVHRALYIRSLVGSASVKKLARMEACVCADGRARGLLQYHGAGTGRWAGRILQPQNFPRGTIQLDKEAPDPQIVVDAIMTGDHEYVEQLLGPPIEVVVGGLRHALVADVGRRLVVGDFAGIEARIVLALAGQHDKCAVMASGQDVYLDMACDIFRKPRGSLNKKEHAVERQIGKNTVLGCGFQMGWRKFKSRYCPDQPDEFAQKAIETYRKMWAPEVPKLWRGLEDAARETVWSGTAHEAYGVEYAIDGRWLTARLPSGRKLWYFQPEPCRKEMPWSTKEEPDVRAAWRYKAKKLGQWRSMDAYGGLLTENVVQALARDLLVHAMFKCEANGFPIVLTVHDEVVSEPLERDVDEEAFRQIVVDSPQWARDMQVPVAAEVWSGQRYRK
jgi:DNA polymerase